MLERPNQMHIPVAVVIGAALIATAILWVGRWEIVQIGEGVMMLDHWTGQMRTCANAAKEGQRTIVRWCKE